jgi:hypothetical protein
VNVLRKTPGKRTADLNVICTVSPLVLDGQSPALQADPRCQRKRFIFRAQALTKLMRLAKMLVTLATQEERRKCPA